MIKHFIATLCIVMLYLPGPARTAAADIPRAEPGSLDLVYRVSADDRSLGTIEIRLSQDTDAHQFDAITNPEGMARLFVEETQESFRFTPSESGWIPKIHSEQSGRDEKTVVVFDKGERLLAYNGKDTSEHPANSLVEPQGFPLATYLVPGDQLDQHDVLMPSNGNMRIYRYSLAGEESLVLNGQEYQTRKWLKQRPGRNDRGFVIWSEKGTGIPVRVENFRSRGSIIMELLPAPLQAAN